MSCYYQTGKGEVCDEEFGVSNPPNYDLIDNLSIFGFILIGLFVVFLMVIIAKYCYRVATRTGRSRVGFVWLSIFFPAVALIICLVLDKDESRYSAHEKV